MKHRSELLAVISERPAIVTARYIEDLILKCSTYEDRLSAHLIDAQQDSPAAVSNLLDIVNAIRCFRAELQAIHPETQGQRYSEALRNQLAQRSRRAELAASVIESKP